jgi:hypothetical protein
MCYTLLSVVDVRAKQHTSYRLHQSTSRELRGLRCARLLLSLVQTHMRAGTQAQTQPHEQDHAQSPALVQHAAAL